MSLNHTKIPGVKARQFDQCSKRNLGRAQFQMNTDSGTPVTRFVIADALSREIRYAFTRMADSAQHAIQSNVVRSEMRI